jgi:hypothetical protein
MREGTNKIMKAAHSLSKREETLFPKYVKINLDEDGE